MKIKFSKRVVKQIERMSEPVKGRIKAAILKLPSGDVIPLEGYKGLYRLRVGGWRVVFSYLENGIILVEKAEPRGGVYK
jgi:mRNA interferase RelE/StbE